MKKFLLGLLLVLAVAIVIFKNTILGWFGVITADALTSRHKNLQPGMTYAEVEKVIGTSGRKVLSIEEDDERLELYIWELDETKVGVYMKNGKLKEALDEEEVRRYYRLYRRYIQGS